jgi:hypothetical protein
MDDTSEAFKVLFRQKIMERSSEERLLMGDSMFASARELVLASLPDTLGAAEKRLWLFVRLYDNDFVPEHKQRIKNILLGCPA